MQKEIIDKYADAVIMQRLGDNTNLENFKNEYKEEYKTITAMYRKRVALKDTFNAMSVLNEPIYWFTLTFNNQKDINTVETKRKQAQSFLKEIAPIYAMVEEYGEDNNRYHIHGFLIFKYGKSFKDFKQWHSRQNLKEIKQDNMKTKIKYLTKYCSKSVPRIRRSKMCCDLYNSFCKHKGLLQYPSILKETMRQCIENKIVLF